jgi:penicillin-binding protein 2
MEGVLDAPDTSESRPGVRLQVVGVGMAVLFATLGLRLWSLTVLQAPAALQAVNRVQLRTVPIEPVRGLILDRDGNPLVANQTVEQITLSRQVALTDPQITGRVAALTGQTVAQIDDALNSAQYSRYKPVPVQTNAPLAEILFVREHQAEYPGVSSVETTERVYPQTELPGPASTFYPAAQALGYVTSINTAELKARAAQGYQPGDPFGQDGLEYQYESALRGTPGTQRIEVTPAGQVAGVVRTVPAVPGDDLVTNLDTDLQRVADNALATQILALRKTFDPKCGNAGCTPAATNGAVVVMSPQTGAVYALSSYPSYNLNEWVGGLTAAQGQALFGPGSLQPALDRAIAGLYVPGSTFKLNTATAALNTGLITPDTPYYDSGTYHVPGCQYHSTTCILHDADSSSTGEMDVTRAIAISSDDFFYNLGYLFYADSGRYGETPIQDQANAYGIGELTGIDLPGEAQGRVDSLAQRTKLHQLYPKAFPNAPTWYTGDEIEMAFGQGGTYVTPIEQAVAYATFANGGTRYAPQVAAALVTPGGRVVKRFAPEVTGHVTMSPATHAALLAGFEGAVQYGTASGIPGLANFPGGVAGKTGTADTELGKEPTAWFIGFGPVADPQYVVVCVIDQAGYGAAAAAPVVAQIFSYLATHPVGPPTIPPNRQTALATTPLATFTPPTVPPTTTTTTLPRG